MRSCRKTAAPKRRKTTAGANTVNTVKNMFADLFHKFGRYCISLFSRRQFLEPGGYVEIWRLAWPLIILSASNTIMMVVNRIFLAKNSPEEIAAAGPLSLCSFDTFELDRYPAEPEPELGGTPRDYMGKVLAYCQRYANSFTPESRGLMFIGSAGLGKTHMALAIADTVLNRGFDVLYTSSAALAAQLGREHFDRAAEDPWLDACKEADLLILDDLGTEYISQLTISVLYELINTRMLCHRPTIYTSNIVDSSIFEARYTEKVASRILGSCQIFKFFGTDQRLKRGGKR